MPQLPGVYQAKKKNGTIYYRSSLTYRAKHISLGSYDTMEAAHNAYLLANRILQDKNLEINNYRADSVLLFEKWVCLINFRDNGLYFSNPIYMSRLFLLFFFPFPFLYLRQGRFVLLFQSQNFLPGRTLFCC